MRKLQEFYQDKHMKKEVFDHITAHAKDLLVEYATKKQPTDWFLPLLEVLQDADKSLDEMFNHEPEVKPINHAK